MSALLEIGILKIIAKLVQSMCGYHPPKTMLNAQNFKIMIAVNQTIPCPTCNGKIIFNVQELIAGGKFSCPNCYSVIAITTESRDLVKETMGKLEQEKDLKRK
ncbi:hypothetical protein H9X96_01000 [Pedobacter sp. N36a]|uniref:hypothetical protein n=1 Tax=Pedobacter sp. N36a TaxID=2767996 RepID=UPI00165751D6|nr:hypothetical protein [Pedobacter sp. N36a]MBC8984346.1 hypothetical protein [Pedobacter sp. N36a]